MPSILDASATCSGRTTVMATATRLSMVRASGSLTTTATVTARGEVLLRPAMYAPTLTTAAGETTPTFGIDLYDGDAQPYDATAVDEARLTVTHKPTGATLVDSELMAVTSGSKAARATYSFGEGQAFELERVGGHTATVAVSAAGETQTVPAGGELAIRAGDTPGYQQLSLDGAGLERGLAARENNRTSTMAAFDSVDVTTADVGEAVFGTATTSGDFGVEQNFDVGGTSALHGDVTLDAASLLGDDADLTLDTQPAISSKTSGVDPLTVSDAAGTTVFEALEGGNVGVPNGQLSEQGNRVATRTWTETADVTAGGSWTFNSNVSFGGNILDEVANIRPEVGGNVVFNLLGSTNTNRITIYDNAGSKRIFNARQNGDVEVPSGQLSEQGNRVATRTWTDSNYNNYTDADAVNAVESTSLLTLNRLEIGTNTASSSEDIKLNANANIASDSSIYHLVGDGSTGGMKFGFGDTIRSGNETYSLSIQAGGTVNAAQGPLQEAGNRVATRPWIDGARSISNQWTFNSGIGFGNGIDTTVTTDALFVNISTNDYAVRDTDSTGVSNLIWRDSANSKLKLGSAHSNVTFRGDHIDANSLDIINGTSFDGDITGTAPQWDGYERYISSSAPSTSNPYIRFEPK